MVRTGRVAADGAQRRPGGAGPVRTGLVVVYLVGLYTYIPLGFLPGPPVPAFLAGTAGFLLLLLNLRGLRVRDAWPLAAYLGLALWGIAVAPEAARYLGERSKSWIYLVYSVAGSLGLFLELARWSRDRLARLFLTATLLILAGAALESYTPLGAVSDAVRRAVFEEGVYAADRRDVLLFGRVRPKLFTSEPSHVAKFFLLSSSVWLGLTRARRRYLTYALLAAAGLFLIRSPIVILTAGAAAVTKVWLDMPGLSRSLLTGPLRRRLGLLAMAAALALLVAGAAATILSTRIAQIASGADESFLLRIAAPALLATETAVSYPFFGVGLGGNDAMVHEMQTAFTRLGVDTSRFEEVAEKLFNVFWMHWIYFGALGGVVAVWLVGLFARKVGARHYLFVASMALLFSQTMGAYNGIRYWSYLMLIFVVSRVRLAELRTVPAAPPATGEIAGV